MGPRKPTATTRKIAVSSEVAAAVSGVLVVVETVNSGTAQASASNPPMIRPGPSSRGSRAASVSASVGGTRAARRPAARTASRAVVTAQPITAAAGSQSVWRAKFCGAMLWLTSAREPPTEQNPWPDSGRGADQGDDASLPGNHAADLTGRRGHRSQQRDLAFALLDRQTQRAGDDEHRDEQRQSAECCCDGDQREAGHLELWVLSLAARVAGEYLGARSGGA